MTREMLGDGRKLDLTRGINPPRTPGHEIAGTVVALGEVPDAEGWNVPGGMSVTRSLDQLLRASDAGRVALITSSAGHCAEMAAYRGVYAATKAALEALGRTYAAETRNITNVRVTLVDPGRVRTRMRTQLMPGEDPQTLPAPEEVAPKILAACAPHWTQTGVLFEAQSGAVKAFQAPA